MNSYTYKHILPYKRIRLTTRFYPQWPVKWDTLAMQSWVFLHCTNIHACTCTFIYLEKEAKLQRLYMKAKYPWQICCSIPVIPVMWYVYLELVYKQKAREVFVCCIDRLWAFEPMIGVYTFLYVCAQDLLECSASSAVIWGPKISIHKHAIACCVLAIL